MNPESRFGNGLGNYRVERVSWRGILKLYMSANMARSPVPPPGIYTPAVTFFNPDSTLDFPSIEAHALRMARGKLAGLVLQGSNGEAVHLENEERITLIRRVRSVLNDNGFSHVKLIAGAGAPSKIQTLRLAREAEEAGADFVLILPPSYWASAMTRPVLVAFFSEVADESPLPVLVYNFPAVSNGVNIDSDTMIELSQHPNIVGCKLTDGVSVLTGATQRSWLIATSFKRTLGTSIGCAHIPIQRTSPSCLGKESLHYTASSPERLDVSLL